METYALLFIALGLPLIVGLMFRVSTAHIFAALMAGELLGRYFGHDVDDFILSKTPQWHIGLGEVALIVLPVILTGLFLRNTTSKGRILLHSVPLVITGIICASFILPILPLDAQNVVRDTKAGELILDYNKIIIGVMIAIQLLWLWLVQGKESKKKKHE